MKVLLPLILALSYVTYAGTLSTCYKAYFFFFPVAHSCVFYKNSDNYMEIEAYIKTDGVGNLLYKVNNYGKSIIRKDSNTLSFFLLQEEGNYKRDMFYHFEGGNVTMYVVKYKGNKKEIEYTRVVSHKHVKAYDPIYASLVLYCYAFERKAGTLPIFYDGNVYKVPFFVAGYDEGEDSLIVEMKPRIITSGIIKPTGEWVVWVDPHINVPVKMELEFTIGSASVVLKRKEGEERVVKDMCKRLGE